MGVQHATTLFISKSVMDIAIQLPTRHAVICIHILWHQEEIQSWENTIKMLSSVAKMIF